MKIADFSIRRPVFAWMLMSGMIIFGSICLLRLGVSQMPDVDFPVLNIGVRYEGASPEIVETELVIPIEGRVMSVEGVKEVRSSVNQGSANIRMEFGINQNIDAALQEVQAALSQLRLPSAVDPPTISKQNPENDPILFIGVASSRPLKEVIRYSDLVLQDQFQMLPGVGEVNVGGFSSRNLRVFVDPEKLKKNYLTVLDIATAIQGGHSELAAGYIEDQNRTTNVRSMGEGYTPEEVGNLWIRRRGNEIIRDPVLKIRDVASVVDGLTDVRRIARVSGQPGLTLAIRKQHGSNEVEVAKAIRKKVQDLEKSLPEGYKIQINADFTRATEQIVKTTMHKLLIAAIVTGIICWFFLGSWTSSINVLLSIPTSVLGTFIVMSFAGFTLNIFTLLALTLSISIVVDDAIMMLENIIRHHNSGKGRVRAASDGANEIWTAAFAATVAVVAIFLPVVFMKGIIGKFFFQFGIVISTAVLLSLVEAITLTPMRCAQFMKRGDDNSALSRNMARAFAWLSERYRAILQYSLNWRWSILGISGFLFLISLLLFSKIRKEFVPSQDQNLVAVSLTTPPGTSLAATNVAMKKVEEFIKSLPEMERYVCSVGAGGPNAMVNSGSLMITLKDARERQLSHKEFANLIREKFKGDKSMRLTSRDLSTRGFTSGRAYPISFNIRGPEYSVLRDKSKEILNRLANSGLALDLDTDYKDGQPELQIIPDRLQAANFGVSIDSITNTISAAISGLKQGQFTNEGRRYDIRVSLSAEDRTTVEKIANLEVRNYLSELVPLKKLVTMSTVSTVQVLSRINRSRAVSVFGNVAPGVSQTVALQKAEEIAREILPTGYTFTLEGAAQTFDESFNSLYLTLILGILIAYMVLASQFNSFIHPLIILLALPFGMSGALLAIWSFNQSLNLYSMIGILLLMGIAKKNSILLVEFTNHIRSTQKLKSDVKVSDDESVMASASGAETAEAEAGAIKTALLQACPIRLRPIIMTSTATVVAALPLAIDSSPGWESRVPMALAIIGGNVISTLFTLFVVPCAYSVMGKWERQPENEIDVNTNLLEPILERRT